MLVTDDCGETAQHQQSARTRASVGKSITWSRNRPVIGCCPNEGVLEGELIDPTCMIIDRKSTLSTDGPGTEWEPK